MGRLERSLDTLCGELLHAALTLGLALNGYSFQAVVLGLALLVVNFFVKHLYNNFLLITGTP